VQIEFALGEFSSPTVKLGLGFSEGALVRDAGSLELCPRGLNLGRGLLKGVEPGLSGLGVRDEGDQASDGSEGVSVAHAAAPSRSPRTGGGLIASSMMILSRFETGLRST
jgi:hypothetical protein